MLGGGGDHSHQKTEFYYSPLSTNTNAPHQQTEPEVASSDARNVGGTTFRREVRNGREGYVVNGRKVRVWSKGVGLAASGGFGG